MASGVSVSFKLVNAAETEALLLKAGVFAMPAMTQAMVAEMESVITDAKKLTPVDTGVLRASGTVLPPDVKGTSVEVSGGFGGAASDYSIPVHERMGVHHPTGQAKFLEQPFLEHGNTMSERMAVRLAAALEAMRVL